MALCMGLEVSYIDINDLSEICYLALELPENKNVRQQLIRGGPVFSFKILVPSRCKSDLKKRKLEKT